MTWAVSECTMLKVRGLRPARFISVGHDNRRKPLSDQSGTIPVPRLHHINLKITRLQVMVDWYVKVVCAEVVFQFPGGAWLTNDRANHRVAFLSSPQMSDDPEKLVHMGC